MALGRWWKPRLGDPLALRLHLISSMSLFLPAGEVRVGAKAASPITERAALQSAEHALIKVEPSVAPLAKKMHIIPFPLFSATKAPSMAAISFT